RTKIDKVLLESPAERELDKEIDRVVPLVGSSLEDYDWKDLTYQLSLLSPAITRFFDEVLVMDTDPEKRESRLALLDKCNNLFLMIGDLGNLNI
ncbi:MAG TPA: DALR anticodon-binding domain-containing protein, partial [Synergistales bacterium]|nr:DALR anticodon-binding domain-containing protein [Synergistales bacterium]